MKDLTVSTTIYPISARNPWQKRRNQTSETFKDWCRILNWLRCRL